ncbi:3-oxoacyl-ACP reductase [Litorivita pollutaquae]|uniref:3-oxoacyl-ACP reductase n=1 Tax=Litorivita pollutaquae TaxID=2200892 RepID=A0A2V4MLD7_9RHOB|nr:SDR family NAD(P)-dependent oxidoreductase [Litorivita pollutaquae]PYC46369.1 3-oxoacyl-ACP reductase [Litorivita pollutaquae]
MSKLDGKTAFITGSGRGIGRSVALKLAAEGANVVVNDLDDAPAAEVVETIKAAGGNAIAHVGSVTEDGFAEAFIQTGVDAFGGADIIVNNAGYTWDAMIGKMSDEPFDAIMDVHAKAPFRILRAASDVFLPAAKTEATGGKVRYRKVVNISSVAGIGGNAGQTNYSSAKSAVLGMTKTLSKEWGRYNVNVNCVAFGFITTRLTKGTDEKKTLTVEGNEIAVGVPKKVIAGFEAAIQMRRAGTPEEAADGVYLPCSPESNDISGQVLTVGGGMTLG